MNKSNLRIDLVHLNILPALEIKRVLQEKVQLLAERVLRSDTAAVRGKSDPLVGDFVEEKQVEEIGMNCCLPCWWSIPNLNSSSMNGDWCLTAPTPAGVDEFVHNAVVSRLGDAALLRIPLITLAPLHKLVVPVAVSVAVSTFVFEGSRSRKVAVDDLPVSRSVAIISDVMPTWKCEYYIHYHMGFNGLAYALSSLQFSECLNSKGCGPADFHNSIRLYK
uniref:Uncharacterized protein n=1 Tax=Glossina pallidipes TaxID=7398 RepID=A0A1A9ZYX3_GLOPL